MPSTSALSAAAGGAGDVHDLDHVAGLDRRGRATLPSSGTDTTARPSGTGFSLDTLSSVSSVPGAMPWWRTRPRPRRPESSAMYADVLAGDPHHRQVVPVIWAPRPMSCLAASTGTRLSMRTASRPATSAPPTISSSASAASAGRRCRGGAIWPAGLGAAARLPARLRCRSATVPLMSVVTTSSEMFRDSRAGPPGGPACHCDPYPLRRCIEPRRLRRRRRPVCRPA